MLIEIVFPVFRCAEDKNVFLSRLCGLPNFRKAEEKEFNFYLTLTGSPLEKEIAELQEICDMWGTKFILLEE